METFLTWTLGLLAILGGIVYWKVRNSYNYFKKRGTPFVEPTFLLGSDVKGTLLLEHTAKSREKLYNKLKGHKVGGFFQITTPLYMVTDPEYITKILITDFAHFYNHGVNVDETVSPLESQLFFLGGQKWRYVRNKLSPIFTSGKLRWMHEEMSKCGDALVEHFSSLANGKDITCKDDLARFTTDVIGSCAFGLNPESLKNPNSIFRVMGRKALEPSFITTLKFYGRMIFPDLYVKFKIKLFPVEIEHFFCSLIKEAFAYREKTGIHRKDMVELLKQLKDKGSVSIDKGEKEEILNEKAIIEEIDTTDTLKIEFTDELLAAQSFVFFAAGFETTSTTLYFTLYFLSKYTKIQDKVRQEVRSVKEKHGEINYEALKDMYYLEKCVSETLRLFPPVTDLFRECTKTYTFPNGIKIEKGMIVFIPIFSLHRDPKYFPDPEVYRPERFDSPPKSGTYLPFGEGPRFCIGKRFALIEIKMAISRLLENFTLELSEKTKEPIELKPNSIFANPKSDIYICIKKI